MAGDERYATTWHGLFPRFVLAGLVLAFVGVLFQRVISAPISVTGQNLSDLAFRSEVSVAFFPFAAFALFYISSRIRINLGNDYAALAASIFLGALAVLLLFGVPEALASGQSELGPSAVDEVLQSTASAISLSIAYTFVGFAAVLLSYRRRI